jgi:hypothetical protein
MDDIELCTLIDRKSKQAIGADDLTSQQREEAYEFYVGEATGELAPPEIEGRSRVVSKDLMDTVEWAMPSLMDTFTSADDIIRFEPDQQEDEQSAQDATNYVGYLIHRKNEDGFITIHDAVKSALICRSGFGKCYVEDSQEYREECYYGLMMHEIEALNKDPEIEVYEVTETGSVDMPSQDGQPPQPMPTYDVKARRTEKVKKFRNEGVPPEEMRISKNTRVLNDCDFIEHRREVTMSYLREQGYDKSKVDDLANDGEAPLNGEEEARHEYDGSEPWRDEETDDSQRKVWLSESYLRVDYDGDGKSEYRRIVKARNVIFENTVVDDHPFWAMTPILMPYKVIGIGFWDLVEDLMRIKTALTRQVLDNVYLTNNPMKEVIEGNIIDMDEILSPRIGGIMRVKARDSVREITTPFVAEAGLAVMQNIDQIKDTRTGVTEMNSAMSGESLAQTNVGSNGVQALMNAGAQRIRLIARVLAETGFKRMYYLMLKNVTQHQDRAQQVKINGRWLNIDPREWKNKYNMTVSVGVGTFGRQQQVANLQTISQMQGALMNMGLTNPMNIYNTAKRTIEAMGYRDPDQFISAPQMGPDGRPQPMPNPGQQQAQAQAQAEMQKTQMTLQAQAQIKQLEMEKDREIETMRMQMQQQTDIVRQRAEAGQQQMKMQMEAQLKQYQMDLDEIRRSREMEFQRWKAELDAATKIQVAQMTRKTPGFDPATQAATAEIATEVQQ